MSDTTAGLPHLAVISVGRIMDRALDLPGTPLAAVALVVSPISVATDGRAYADTERLWECVWLIQPEEGAQLITELRESFKEADAAGILAELEVLAAATRPGGAT